MALILRKALLENISPLLQTKRFRGKINLKRPKPPHFERALFFELTKPYFINPKKDKKPMELCNKNVLKGRNDELNPLQQIIAQELSKWFDNSRLVAFYHQNPMDAGLQYKAYLMFHKEKMHYKNYGKKTLEMAVKGTKYEPVLDFYVSQNMTVFSPEPDVRKLLKITKKFPQLVLLTAIFDGKMVSKDKLMEYSMIPNLQAAQANLVHTLNSIGGTVVNQLNTHQNTLVSQLQERAKQLGESGN